MPKRLPSEVQIVGLQHHAAGEVLPFLVKGLLLELRREPNNPHDANAIAVIATKSALLFTAAANNQLLTKSEYQIGHVAREAAAELAPNLDWTIPVRCTLARAAGSGLPVSLPAALLPAALLGSGPSAAPKRPNAKDRIAIWI